MKIHNVFNVTLIIMVGFLMVGLLGACTPAPAPTEVAEKIEEVQTPPTVEVEEEEPIQLAFFAPQANTYVAASYKGITEVAEKFGAEVTFFDTGFDASKEYNQIQDAITQEKFDAFIIIPLDQMLLIPVVEEAIANAVPAPAITAALFARFSSREDNSPAMKMVSALRHQFGGHATRPAK